MSITIQHNDQYCKVAILGQLEQDSDKQQLLTLLKSCQTALELYFYDAELLPADILIAISKCLESGISIKLVVYRELLSDTLSHLNLPFRKVLNQSLIEQSLNDCKAIVLAGSAHSLDKIIKIIKQLPDADITVFVIQHIREDQTNLLDKLLKVITNYRVIMPHHLMPVETGVIYIAPPAHHLHIANGLVYLTQDKKIQFARPSIDVLFESIGYEYGHQALAVLLCGFGQDGVKGCELLKAKGALVFLEKLEECEDAKVLLEQAKASGYYHSILSCDALTSIIAATALKEKAEPSGKLQQLFLTAIKTTYGYDLLGYQKDSMERRIKSVMLSFGATNFADFQRLILTDVKLFQRFIIEISVGVSHFFRHPEQISILRNEILPYLASFPLIKIWSAGCSTGEEAYSVAIVLSELGLLEKSRLFATDINPHLLELAKMQLFSNECLKISRLNYINSSGLYSFDNYIETNKYFFKMADYLKQRTLFHCHSLTQDGVFNEFELIICRNVLIYFDVEMQKKVLRCFADSLHADGFLVLGPQDGIQLVAQSEGFMPYSSGSCIYKLARENRNV